MPQNKRESLIYTMMMCFFMVLWMSIYNVSWNMGGLSMESVKEGWIGFPLAYVVAICCDWFLVSGIAKFFAFRFLIKSESGDIQKIIAISGSMVVLMVIIMSCYGTIEVCIHSHTWNQFMMQWITNILRNFVMAVPVQFILAGPIIRRLFRKVFPVGSVLA